jgi:dipeptidyl aminopeptidase/acylaminoacyl peptidase
MEHQCFAAAGFGVMLCNPRGSSGYGALHQTYERSVDGSAYYDCLQFVDECVRRYDWIDGERLGVTGGSYGGYMTNWIIGHTDRFAAAASQRSISNWISELLVSDISVGFIHNMMSFPDIRHCDKELWDMSPLKYVNNAVTPTLFIHSTEDYRCPMPEAVQMFTALRLVGVDTKLVMFNGENHGLSRGGKPKHRIRRLKEITAWMNQYLENNE